MPGPTLYYTTPQIQWLRVDMAEDYATYRLQGSITSLTTTGVQEVVLDQNYNITDDSTGYAVDAATDMESDLIDAGYTLQP